MAVVVTQLMAKLGLDDSGFQAGIKKANADVKTFSGNLAKGLKDASAKPLAELGKTVNDVSNKMVVSGVAIVGALGKTVEVAGHYDQALRDVSAVNKLTEKQFRELHDAVIGLTDDPLVTQGPTELAKGMYRIASAGFDGKEGLEVMRQAAIGATAGMSDTATSSLALIAALKSFPPGMYSAQQAMDLLIGEVDLGVNTFPELANSIGRVLPIASQAQVGLDEVTAAVATMTRGGLKADEAVTYLTQLLNHIIKPSKEAADAMDKLGIAHGMAAFQANGLKGVLDQVIEKTKGNKQAITELFPEIRAMGGALILARNNGADLTDILEKERGKLDGVGAAHQVAAEQVKGFDEQTKKAWQQVETMSIKIGEDLLPAARDIVKDVGKAASAFHGLSDETRHTLVTMAEWTGVGLVVVGTIGKIGAAAVATAGKIGAIRDALIGLAASGGPQAIGTGGILGLLAAGGGAAIYEANRAFDVGPNPLHSGHANNASQMNAWDRFFSPDIANSTHGYTPGPTNIDPRTGRVILPQAPPIYPGLLGWNGGFDLGLGGTPIPGPQHTGGIPTGSGGKGGKESKDADDAIQKALDKAEQVKQAIVDSYKATFDAIYSDYQQKDRDITEHYYNALDAGVPAAQAFRQYAAEHSKLVRDAAKEQTTLLRKQQQEVSDEASAEYTAQEESNARKRHAAEQFEQDMEQLGMQQRAHSIQLLQEEEAERHSHAEALMKYAVDANLITLEDYKHYLQDKAAADEAYSEAWIQHQTEIDQINKQIVEQDKQLWADFNNANADIAKSAVDAWQPFKDVLVNEVGSAFDQAILKGKNFFDSLITGLERTLEEMAVKWLSSQFVNLLGQGLGALIGAVGGGGAVSGGNAGNGYYLGGMVDARAAGGPVSGNAPYLVGENGPELFVPGASGRAVNNQQLAGAMGGGGNTIVYQTIHAQDAQSFRRNETQIASQTAQNLQYHQRRNGGS